MRIVITGASGFLGQHVVERLKREHEIVCLLRKGDAPVGTGLARGDVTDADSVLRAIEGAEAVIHAAGIVSQDPEMAQRLFDVHVRGTENVVEACRRHGMKRLVYISTSGTVAVSEKPRPIPDESAATPDALIARWPYYRTKLYAEELVLKVKDFPVVSLNPSLLLGPGDTRGESVKSVRMFLEDQVPAAPPGGLSFVDVRDVAAVVETALYKGKGRYLLGGANMTFQDFFERLGRVSDRPAPMVRSPGLTKKVLEFLPDWGKQGIGFGFAVDRWALDQACYYWYLDDSKARKELGFRTRDANETLRDTVADILWGSSRFAPPERLGL